MANTGNKEIEQQDVNPNSPTYGQKRWVNAGVDTALCPLPNVAATWSATGVTRCQTGTSGNTGYLEVEQKDTNSQSASFNQIRYVQGDYNTSACPLPIVATYTGEQLSYGFLDMASACAYGVGEPATEWLQVYTESGELQPGERAYWDEAGQQPIGVSAYFKRFSFDGLVITDSEGIITEVAGHC